MKRTRALTLLVVMAIATSCSPWGDLKDETSLRLTFQRHRVEFEQIRELFVKDAHLVRVAPSFTRLQNDWSWPREDVGLTQERWDLYRRLFITADVPDGVELQGDQIFYYMSSVGLSVSGTSRGVVYAPHAPRPIVDSLDGSRGEGVFYVSLEDQWYLFQWTER